MELSSVICVSYQVEVGFFKRGVKKCISQHSIGRRIDAILHLDLQPTQMIFISTYHQVAVESICRASIEKKKPIISLYYLLN